MDFPSSATTCFSLSLYGAAGAMATAAVSTVTNSSSTIQQKEERRRGGSETGHVDTKNFERMGGGEMVEEERE